MTADALVSSGLAELGYVYVNIGTFPVNFKNRVFFMFWFILELTIFQISADDCWSAQKRDSKVISSLFPARNLI